MIKFKLDRIKSSKMGTLGLLTTEQLEVCQTLELPWRDNERGVSCIPDGEYLCKRDFYHAKGYEVFELQNVEKRSAILIHVGNFLKDTKGCILVGMVSGNKDGEYCVYKSKQAFDIFMSLLKEENEFCLSISNTFLNDC